ILAFHVRRSVTSRVVERDREAAARRTEGSASLALLPILLDRLRRLCGARAMDDEVLRAGVRLRHQARRSAGRVLFTPRGRAAGDRRLAIRQVRRAEGHLVGAMGFVAEPVRTLVSTD